MKNSGCIPTPWKHRWRRFRYSVLPPLCFLLCLPVTMYLWRAQGRSPNAIGEVEAMRFSVAACTDGQLEPLLSSDLPGVPAGAENRWWTLYQKVRKGQVIARLDSAPLQAALEALVKEKEQFEAEVGATKEQLRIDVLDLPSTERRTEHDYIGDIENLRLEMVDRQALIAADTIELQRLNASLAYLEGLATRGVAVEMQIVDVRLQRDVTAKRIETNKTALEEVKGQLARAEVRLKEKPEADSPIDVDVMLQPLRKQVEMQESLIAEIQAQIDLCEIVAPTSGTICEIFCYPGQQIRAGDPILTIARDNGDEGRYVVSRLKQEQRIAPQEGDEVTVRARIPGSEAVIATIVAVSPQFEPVPLTRLVDSKVQEWARPIRIRLPDPLPAGVKFTPGELVDVTYKR